MSHDFIGSGTYGEHVQNLQGWTRCHPENQYHLILLDMKLPDSDGMEILKTVRGEKLEMYIIVMTGYATIRSAVSAMRLGAFDYLPKPFTDEELITSVEKAIRNCAGSGKILKK